MMAFIHSPRQPGRSSPKQFQWAMFLDEAGEVVWSENLPEDVPLSYTVSDAASFFAVVSA